MRNKHWLGAMALCTALAIATPALAAPAPAAPDWASAAAHGASAGGAEATVARVFTQADTPGDVPYGSGDITAIKVEHRSNTVRLSLRTKLGSNPAASASWRGGYTWIVWAIDVNNGGGPDFLAGIFNDGSGVFTEVVRNDAGFTHRCATTFTHNESNQFRIEFPRTCISSHPAIRAYATMQYDRYPTNPNAPVSVDYSPNATWTPNVSRAT